jgi:hypothetical protein
LSAVEVHLSIALGRGDVHLGDARFTCQNLRVARDS